MRSSTIDRATTDARAADTRRAASKQSATTRRNFLRGVGLAGAAAVAGPATAPVAAQEDGASGGTEHVVDMTDDLIFDPETLTVAPGDTVRWVNVGGVGHSVTAYEDGIPEDADFFASGDFETESAARSGYPQRGDVPGGEEYSHTFEVEGDYEYFCIPHESVGMIGEISVVPGGATPEPAVNIPTVPDAAKSLALATTTALVSVVALAYFFLKYGGDYGSQEPSGRAGRR